ncbi:MAG: peroxiredoxin family protein [Chloroflexi bacterium]|nr:peroxiredoxin family protein [Chloroflexota bacterium]
MQRNYQEIQDLQAEILAVSVDDLSEAAYIVEEIGLRFPVLYNPDADVVRQYGVYDLLGDGLATPATFVIDRQGNVHWKYVGRTISDHPSSQQIISKLKELQAEAS